MNFESIKEEIANLFNQIKFFFKNIFKKNQNFKHLQNFKIDFKTNSEILFKNCDKILNFLYEIEEKERSAEKIEITFLMPVHDLIQELIKEKIELEKNLDDLMNFFNENIIESDKPQIDKAKNKKNSYQFLDKIKLTIFEINESFYKALKFDEITDILELNKELVENLSGLDEQNHKLETNEIFNQNETLISIFEKITASVENLQKKLVKPGFENF